MNWKQLHKNAFESLNEIEEGEEIAWQLIEHLSSLPRFKIITDNSLKPTPNQIVDFEVKIIRLQNEEPLQYVLGYAHFFGMKLKVNADVLIPRPETEELLDLVFALKPNCETALDLCTGSGCIALGLQKYFVVTEVFGTDISEGAMDTARTNANDMFSERKKPEFFLHNLLTEDKLPTDKKFDLIVSNPPYICPTEANSMSDSVTKFEPHLALFAPENDPLVFYKRLLTLSKDYLKPDGVLVAEINPYFAKELLALGLKSDFICSVRKDLSGKERFWVVEKG